MEYKKQHNTYSLNGQVKKGDNPPAFKFTINDNYINIVISS